MRKCTHEKAYRRGAEEPRLAEKKITGSGHFFIKAIFGKWH